MDVAASTGDPLHIPHIETDDGEFHGRFREEPAQGRANSPSLRIVDRSSWPAARSRAMRRLRCPCGRPARSCVAKTALVTDLLLAPCGAGAGVPCAEPTRLDNSYC